MEPLCQIHRNVFITVGGCRIESSEICPAVGGQAGFFPKFTLCSGQPVFFLAVQLPGGNLCDDGIKGITVLPFNDYFTVIDGCATYGTIQSDRWFNTTEKFMGIICASFNAKKVTVKNCILGGKIGPYTPTEEDPLITLDATNFQDYYSLTAANRIANVVFENNSFGTRP